MCNNLLCQGILHCRSIFKRVHIMLTVLTKIYMLKIHCKMQLNAWYELPSLYTIAFR